MPLRRNQYKNVSINTASPQRRLFMLFDGAIRFCNQALSSMETNDLDGKGSFLGKAQAIVQELQASLRADLAPDLCANLSDLYIYIIALMTEANIQSTTKPVEECVALLTTVRDGFRQALGEAAMVDLAAAPASNNVATEGEGSSA